MKFTRAASVWSSLTAGFLILIVLLIFITQNTAIGDSSPSSVGAGRLPLGVAILLAAVGGGLITVAAGTARIYQLRRAAKKNLAAAGLGNQESPAARSARGRSTAPRSPRPGRTRRASELPDIRLRKSMPAAMMASLK